LPFGKTPQFDKPAYPQNASRGSRKTPHPVRKRMNGYAVSAACFIFRARTRQSPQPAMSAEPIRSSQREIACSVDERILNANLSTMRSRRVLNR
jgi:hypothetical protein